MSYVDENYENFNKYCEDGNITEIKLLISKITHELNWNWGLYRACDCGHMEIVELMISKGAIDWNSGLQFACIGGHMKIVNLMIAKGATDWNLGLRAACAYSHYEIAELMISKGASDYYDDNFKKYLMCKVLATHLKKQMICKIINHLLLPDFLKMEMYKYV